MVRMACRIFAAHAAEFGHPVRHSGPDWPNTPAISGLLRPKGVVRRTWSMALMFLRDRKSVV